MKQSKSSFSLLPIIGLILVAVNLAVTSLAADKTLEMFPIYERPKGTAANQDDKGAATAVYYYASTQANAHTASKFIYLFAPDASAVSKESLTQFVQKSGWADKAEAEGAVLALPVAPNGWARQDLGLIVQIYEQMRSAIPSHDPTDVDVKTIWNWETVVCMVGYEQGAAFAGNAALTYPNRFATVALVGGLPTVDLAKAGAMPSDHFLIASATDYHVVNAQVPAAVWIIGKHGTDKSAQNKLVSYLKQSDGIAADSTGVETIYNGLTTQLYRNAKEAAQQIRVSSVIDVQAVPQTTNLIFDTFITNIVRWKNGPDGTLKTYYSKQQIESANSPLKYEDFHVSGENFNRYYYVYVPQGVAPAAGLPVVFSIHGRFENAWMFSSKNGWSQLANRENFLVVYPNAPKLNWWNSTSDPASYPAMIEDIAAKYKIDRTRIYITGFSNGNAQAMQVAMTYPGLFAGLYPSSSLAIGGGPNPNAAPPPHVAKFKAAGLELPVFSCWGDNDGFQNSKPGEKDSPINQSITLFVGASGGPLTPTAKPEPMYYQPSAVRGPEFYGGVPYQFENADRFKTYVYHNAKGSPRLALTVLKNMPHGTVFEESKAAWEFLSRFSRNPDGSLTESLRK